MSRGSDEDIEEERRLCYVAMTRAQQRLLLSHAGHRRIHGAYMPAVPSRFIDEIPAELIDEIAGGAADTGAVWDSAPSTSVWGSSGGSSAARAAARRRRPQPAAPARVARGADPGDGYPVGAMVEHPRFGPGQITAREGSGKHLKLTIQFSGYGPKKILPSYTKLDVRAG
jgi:DNA helicase-2/ATP-dependent DNA helicase PcrA